MLKRNFIETTTQNSIVTFMAQLNSLEREHIRNKEDAVLLMSYIQHIKHDDYKYSEYDKLYLDMRIMRLRRYIEKKRKEKVDGD